MQQLMFHFCCQGSSCMQQMLSTHLRLRMSMDSSLVNNDSSDKVVAF